MKRKKEETVLRSRVIPHLVLTLEVFQEGLVEIGGNAVEQRPQHSLRELMVVQILHLDMIHASKRHSHIAAVS